MSVVAAAAAAGAAAKRLAVGNVPAGYVLQWSDEFDGEALDTEKWAIEVGHTVSVSGGKLILTADGTSVEDVTNGAVRSADVTPVTFEKGSLDIHNRFFAPGYLEVRMKGSQVRGMMSSAWTITDWIEIPGASGDWYAGEMDIIEQQGREPDVAWTNNHHWFWPNNFANVNERVDGADNVFTSIDPAVFHTYAIWWDTSFVRQYIDGVLTNERNLAGDAQPGIFGHSTGIGLMLQCWVITNPAWWGGEDGVDFAALPTQAEYEYVRYYAP